MFPANSKLLIVDDMMTMRKLVAKACREIGFSDFSEASDGAKAWEIFSSAAPSFDLIISDWNMPNCSGLDFLKRVRGDSRFKSVPFVLLTAESEVSQVTEALKAGVSGYIVKPFTPEVLRKNLEDIFKKRAA